MLLGEFVRSFGDFIAVASAASLGDLDDLGDLGDLGDFGETLPFITNLSPISFNVLFSVSFSETRD